MSSPSPTHRHTPPRAAEFAPVETERLAGALALRLAELAAHQPDPARLADELTQLLRDELGAAQVVLFTRRAPPGSAKARPAPDHLRMTISYPAGENRYEGALRAAALRASREQRLIESRANTDWDATLPDDPYIVALPLGALAPTRVLALRWEPSYKQPGMQPLSLLIRLAPALALAARPLHARRTTRTAARTATPAASSSSTLPAKTAIPLSSLPSEGKGIGGVGTSPAKTATPPSPSFLHEERAGERGDSPAALLALMSHELRTPLNTINGFLEILLDGLAGPLSERQREFLAYAHTSTRRLTQLLEDMVLLSRPAQSDSLLYRAWTDPHGPIEAACGAHAEAIQTHGVTLSCEIAPGLPPLWADATRLTQALTYLLGWALARTPPGGAVTLRAGPHAGSVVITLEDSGPALERATLGQLFEPARPAPSSGTASATTGLELAVAQRIITLHGGELRASPWPEGGVRLCCALPAADEAAPENAPEPRDQP